MLLRIMLPVFSEMLEKMNFPTHLLLQLLAPLSVLYICFLQTQNISVVTNRLTPKSAKIPGLFGTYTLHLSIVSSRSKKIADGITANHYYFRQRKIEARQQNMWVALIKIEH